MRAPTSAAARLIPTAVLLSLALGAQAAPDAPQRLAPVFGNTIKATYPDGRFQRYWLKRDGSWTAIGRRGHASSGRWTAEGERLCLRQTRPVPAPMKYCTSLPDTMKLGASWPAKDMGGGPITVSLVKGHG